MDVLTQVKENIPYQTSDVRLACTLMARGHRVITEGISKDIDGTVWFSFWNNDIAEDVRAWREGRELKVDLHKLWYAYILFRSALHGPSRDMMIIVSLLALGNQVKEGGIKRKNNLVTYEFEEGKSEMDIGSFLEWRDIPVDASEFWNAMSKFRSNIHNV